jgi:hypothetical protein
VEFKVDSIPEMKVFGVFEGRMALSSFSEAIVMDNIGKIEKNNPTGEWGR